MFLLSFILLASIASLLTTTVDGHYYGSCIGSMDRTKSVPCSTDDIYVYVNTNHGSLTGSCYHYDNQARIDVTSSGMTKYSRRPTAGNVMSSTSSLIVIPNCLGKTATGSNTICKATGMQPNHCSGNSRYWYRYGPIDHAGAAALTISVFGMGCDSSSTRKVFAVTPSK